LPQTNEIFSIMEDSSPIQNFQKLFWWWNFQNYVEWKQLVHSTTDKQQGVKQWGKKKVYICTVETCHITGTESVLCSHHSDLCCESHLYMIIGEKDQ
jgi:hypothetical protein